MSEGYDLVIIRAVFCRLGTGENTSKAGSVPTPRSALASGKYLDLQQPWDSRI